MTLLTNACFLLICFVIVMASANAYNGRILCQQRQLTKQLSCPSGLVLRKVSAIQGRRPWLRYCFREKKTISAKWENIPDVSRRCEGQESCRLPYDYLVVRYDCKKPERPMIRDDHDCEEYPCMIFMDDFNTLDNSVWDHEITMTNGAFAYYLNNRTNTYVRNGTLFIKPTLTVDRFTSPGFLTSGTLDLWGGNPSDLCTANLNYGCRRTADANNIIDPIQSARLRTHLSFNFRYGKIEFRAKLPAGDWLWPALWLMPTRMDYGQWPASGEIDILESRGNRNLTLSGTPVGAQWASQTLHWGPYSNQDPYWHTHVETVTPTGSFADDFHTFGAEWTDGYLCFFIDGRPTGNYSADEGFWKLGNFDSLIPGTNNPWDQPGSNKMAPFDKEFYIIMNVAVGGTFFPDDGVNPGGKPWKNNASHPARDFWNGRDQWLPTWNMDKRNGEDAALKVDYVKVWKLKPDP